MHRWNGLVFCCAHRKVNANSKLILQMTKWTRKSHLDAANDRNWINERIYSGHSQSYIWIAHEHTFGMCVCVCVCILFTDQNALVLIWQMHFVGNLYCEKWAIADIYICNGNGSNATKLAVNNCPCRIFCSSLGTNPNETFIIWTSHDSDASV